MTNNVIDIIKKYLIDSGYDGLMTDDYECRCTIDDLRRCDDSFAKCIPAYRDPLTDKFVPSKDHFLDQLNKDQK